MLKKVDEGEPAVREVRTQLKDFDDCWNAIAKQVISRVQAVSHELNVFRNRRGILMVI